ncbi:hypothetical protein KXP75_000648 [Staphylococcus pseudintermedius]|uniref:YopX family protein n=1 Tax=Staphylococcus pseudintermedius TaxID=283734 RepID=UPI00143FACB2|nr:YopX family protein [Staphylococcus pseudintermedius]EGQ3407841.1 hypothetical protein [Staphylococcus pseudintermedius]EHT8056067.1 hypothetical protein [Staphylococcus pseudintermedius]EJA1858556.1 hypothetical protein [Staphylococcus pseudintermedius]EJD8533367.1 hypothetical protein [Staphylococcus pseudintermedius]NKM73731.1 hypothetical protein [Staphylococcus pseudintermedius]
MLPKLRVYVKKGDNGYIKYDSDIYKILLDPYKYNYHDEMVFVSDELIVMTTNKKHVVHSTGLYDSDKVEIFNKDIVREVDDGSIGLVEYTEGQFRVAFDNVTVGLNEVSCYVQVIGNIYENKDLLREER